MAVIKYGKSAFRHSRPPAKSAHARSAIRATSNIKPTRRSVDYREGLTTPLCREMWRAVRQARRAETQRDFFEALEKIRAVSRRGGRLVYALRGDHMPIRWASTIHELAVQACSERVARGVIDHTDKGAAYLTGHGTPAFERLSQTVIDLREADRRQHWYRYGDE